MSFLRAFNILWTPFSPCAWLLKFGNGMSDLFYLRIPNLNVGILPLDACYWDANAGMASPHSLLNSLSSGMTSPDSLLNSFIFLLFVVINFESGKIKVRWKNFKMLDKTFLEEYFRMIISPLFADGYMEISSLGWNA